MENLAPIYRLKSGYIEFSKELKLDFLVGFVYNDNGNYLIELHFDELKDLEGFYNQNQDAFYEDEYKLVCNTDEGHKFTAPKILMKSFPFHKSMGNFYCFDYLMIEKDIYEKLNEDTNKNPLKYLKLEGLRMLYSSHTFIEASRTSRLVQNKEIGGNKLWDHSVIIFQIDLISYKFIIRDDKDGEAIIEFEKPEAQYQALSYNLWEKIKLDFIEFLSFLNGAPVIIRAEYYGQYYTVGELDAQIKRLYSAQYHKPKRWNNYIPINNSWYRSDNIVNKAFFLCFEKFQELNKKLDLNTIIFYLNNAEQASSIGERIFIQTILLERFSDKYAETFDEPNTTIINSSKFQKIKEELCAVLNNHKVTLGTQFNLFRSIIMNLNNTKRKQTVFKFKQLIEGANIEITEEIEILLNSRNRIIHSGDIGSFNEALKNYHLMDRLIRKIIVNLIGYDGVTIDTGKHLQNPPIPQVRNKVN
jgi:hypothetical protein